MSLKDKPQTIQRTASQRVDLSHKSGAGAAKSVSGAKVLSRRDEIPSHTAVLSATGALLSIPVEWQKNYAVLLVNNDKKDVIVVVSTDVLAGQMQPDDNFLSIVDRIQRDGFIRTRKILARPEILAIIYEAGSNIRSSEESQRAATKIQLDFDDLLRQAVSIDASDIHIEVRRDEAKVRMRKNGELFDYAEWPVKYARTMAGVIYMVMADEKDTTFDDSRPQDAIIDRELSENLRLRVRLATLPAYPAGFDMIMRILKMGQGGKRTSLDKLGYAKPQLTQIRRAVAKPVGAIILAGTTGSGKSTSLNSMLGEKIEFYDGRIKVITVEDPPEYQLFGATQSPVVRSRSQAKAGDKTINPFAAVVRAAMRSDPDILMVGEVRDESSAELLIHAVQSGHQVFTTVHAASGINIIARLRSNGISDDVLGGQNFISALMYQTLVPIVCPRCAWSLQRLASSAKSDQENEVVERIYKYLKPSLLEKLRFKSDTGCEHCSNQGVVGRSVAAEVILPDPYMLHCFRERNDAEAFMHYRKKGGKIALEHGLIKAIDGLVDIRDVELKLDQITYLEELQSAADVLSGVERSSPFIIDESVFDGRPESTQAIMSIPTQDALNNETENTSGLSIGKEGTPATNVTKPGRDLSRVETELVQSIHGLLKDEISLLTREAQAHAVQSYLNRTRLLSWLDTAEIDVEKANRLRQLCRVLGKQRLLALEHAPNKTIQSMFVGYKEEKKLRSKLLSTEHKPSSSAQIISLGIADTQSRVDSEE